MRVIGIGNALIDVLAKITDDHILIDLGLPKGGMVLIDEDKFKDLSDKLKKMDCSIVSAGSASNSIVGLASLGVEAAFIGRVGDDAYGELYKEDLLKHHVTPRLNVVNETSGVASTFISTDGERTFGTYLGAAALLSTNDISPASFIGYDLLYIEGYLVQSHELIEKAVRLAKDAGLKVAMDLASYNVVEGNHDFLLSIITRYIDIVFSNEEEAKALVNLQPEEAVDKIGEMADIAIVKAGANGSWIKQGSTKIHVPAKQNIRCVDTTGAGDLYAAGFLYGLAEHKTLENCGKIGSILAAEVIQHIGPKIPANRWTVLKDEISKI